MAINLMSRVHCIKAAFSSLLIVLYCVHLCTSVNVRVDFYHANITIIARNSYWNECVVIRSAIQHHHYH